MTQTKRAVTASSTGKWKAYPAYKDSGVEWLGEIPAHWEHSTIKRYLVSLKDGTHGTFERVLEGVPFLSAKNVANGKLEISDHESLISYTDYETINQNGYLKLGDLLLTIVGTIGRAAIFSWPEPVAFQRSVAVLRFRDNQNACYFYYLTQSRYFQAYLFSRAKESAQSGVYLSDVGLLPVLSPPLPEQRAIAAFLDRETDRINTLIAKKERLIKLLQEKRAALISHAVTKGLDLTVPMKDSGVEWLGEIPAHWEVRRMKFAASFFGGGTPFKENLEYWSGDIPWVSPKDMKAEIIHDAEDHITKEAIENSSTRLVQPGAVLIVVRSGILKHSIPVAINVRAVALNQDMKAIVLQNFLKPEYLASVIRGHQSALLVEWRKEGATVESIEYELLVNTLCPIPPLAEQHDIVDYLKSETAKIDALISRIREGIEKLKEYSTALISAAVTGKIDVRETIGNQAEHLL